MYARQESLTNFFYRSMLEKDSNLYDLIPRFLNVIILLKASEKFLFLYTGGIGLDQPFTI